MAHLNGELPHEIVVRLTFEEAADDVAAFMKRTGVGTYWCWIEEK